MPGIRIDQWRGQFEAAGWHVVEVKYGRRLAAGVRPAGRRRRCAAGSTRCRTSSTSRCSGWPAPTLREQFLDGAPAEVGEFDRRHPRRRAGPAGHRPGRARPRRVLDAFAQCDAVTDRPSVVFAYTVKGWGLPIAGNPRNHSALLTTEQVDALRTAHGLTRETEWDRLDPAVARPASGSPAAPGGAGPRRRASRRCRSTVPDATERPRQQADLHPGGLRPGPRRPGPRRGGGALPRHDRARRGHLDQPGRLHQQDRGVRPDEQRSWNEDRMLRWAEEPDRAAHRARHLRDEPVPAARASSACPGTCRRSRCCRSAPSTTRSCCRGLDAFLYGTYSGSRFVVAGTPSGITLAPEGGAHQSTITASVGLELPGVTFVEPAYGDGARLAALRRARPDRRRPAAGRHRGARRGRRVLLPAHHPPDRPGAVRGGPGPDRRRGAAPAGARRAPTGWSTPTRRTRTCATPARRWCTWPRRGAVLPEVLAAAEELAEEGIAAHVVDVTSLDRLYSAWQRTLRQGVRTATAPSVAGCAAGRLRPTARPVVTVHDAVVARDGLARLGARGARPCRSGWTRSASPAACTSSTSCTTCCPAASSTPPWRRSASPADAAPADRFAATPTHGGRVVG